MPSTRRRQTRSPAGGSTLTDAEALACFHWSREGAGLDSLFPDGKHFKTAAVARETWQRLRRQVWARHGPTHLSNTARTYDRLSNLGEAAADALWDGDITDLDVVLEALARDRAAVDAFEKRDPVGAQSIADFLSGWRQRLDATEREARRVAADLAAGRRGHAPHSPLGMAGGGHGAGDDDVEHEDVEHEDGD